MQLLKNILLICLSFCLPSILFAQETASKVKMADQFYEDGKIYIVVIVIVTILIGLFAYLFVLDKKLKKLEKDQD